MDGYNDYEIDREIDIKDMFQCALKKWKQFLIGAVIICVLVCAYGLMKSKKEVKVETDPKASLTKEEIANVDTAYAIYKQAMTTKEMLVSEAENSALSQIDASNAVGAVDTYVVESDIENVFNYYKNANILSDEEKKTIIEATGLNNETTNIEDLVSIYTSQDNGYLTDSSSHKISFSVAVYADNKDTCKLILGIVENHISTMSANISASYQKIDSLYDNEIRFISDSQVSLADKLDSINQKLSGLKEPQYLSDSEKTYYTYLVDNNGKKADKKTDVVSSSMNWKKYIVVGAGAGVVLMLAFYVLQYVLSDRVHKTEEFKGYGLDNIGVVNATGGNTVIDEELIVSNIVSYMNLHEFKNLFMCVDYNDEKVNALIQNIVKKLNAHNVTAYVGNPLSENDAFNAFVKCESVVLFEVAEKSKYENVEKVVTAANRQNIFLGGVVTIY